MSNLFKFYFDFVSPLSRPFWILFKHAGVSCELVPVALRKGEHFSEGFVQDVNRFSKLPAINDNGFKLSESVAIFHYLGRKGFIPERWYPKDVKTLAKIDEYLQWNHNNLHIGAGMLFFMQQVIPMRTGKQPSVEEVKEQEKMLNRNLIDLENIWLADNKFVAGDEITFADLLAASAIEQTLIVLFTVDGRKYPKVHKWLQEVRDYFGPLFVEAHNFVYVYAKKNKEKV